MTLATTTIVPLAGIGAPLVDDLLDRAFGTDRRARTAYRLRAGVAPIAELSFAVIDDADGVLGTMQSWPVRFIGDDGRNVPMILVGPVAVEPDLQRGGIGRALMRHMLAAAQAGAVSGADALMLIGDPEYYGRFFDFTADRTGGWRLPGPFEARRLLARGHAVPTGTGAIGPRRA